MQTTTEPRTVTILPPIGIDVQITYNGMAVHGTVLHICSECGRVHVRDEDGEEHFVPLDDLHMQCGENDLEDVDATEDDD